MQRYKTEEVSACTVIRVKHNKMAGWKIGKDDAKQMQENAKALQSWRRSWQVVTVKKRSKNAGKRCKKSKLFCCKDDNWRSPARNHEEARLEEAKVHGSRFSRQIEGRTMRSGCMVYVCMAANLKARIVTGRKQGVNRAVSFLS